jgi:NAD(P)H-dependent FMN reductase
MINITAFGGSNSRVSINRQLAQHAAGLFSNASITLLDLNDYEMPLFSVDKEAETGPQEKAQLFIDQLRAADLLVVSLAEHNGSYSAAFKNILDWASRIDGKLFAGKPMLLLATSPGGRGGASVLEAAKSRFPFLGADIKASFSLPAFNQNFNAAEGIVSETHRHELAAAVQQVAAALQ